MLLKGEGVPPPTCAAAITPGKFGDDVTLPGAVITDLVNSTTYYIRLTSKNSAGMSGFGPAEAATAEYVAGSTFTITENTVLYAIYTTDTAILRKVGPAGGWVFHDAGSSQGWGRYLEAWTSDEAGYQWKTAGTADAIGTGYANTYSCMTGAEHPAAEAARALTYGSYTDWHVPSKDELYEMCWVLHSRRWNGSAAEDNPAYGTNRVGNFSDNSYWSSSEPADTTRAWRQRFESGEQFGSVKDAFYRFRAVRAF